MSYPSHTPSDSFAAMTPAAEPAKTPVAAAIRKVIAGIDPWLGVAVLVTTLLLLGGSSAGERDTEIARWLSGSATVLGGALVLAILSRSLPALWPGATMERVLSRFSLNDARSVLVIALTSFIVYASIARFIFDATPLNLDEIAQLVQARIFADGSLWRPAPAHPEFFSIYHVVDVGGRVYGQFPAGGPAMLALGESTRTVWLVVPLCAAVAIAAWCATLRVAEPRRGVALGAALLVAFSPFFAFLAGTSMNHVPALMWILVAGAALVHATRDERSHPRLMLISGIAFGLAATIRPADALAFALPAAVWIIARTIANRTRWRELAAAGIGLSLPLAVLMWVNVRTTGAPLLFGYEVLWGKAHGIGFHRDPSGAMHTPARGLVLLSGYLRALQLHLFELPIPSLLAPLLALAIGRRAGPIDRYLLASAALLLSLYGAYWFDGQYLGPRFLLPLVPVLALWTARLPALVRERAGDGLMLRFTAYGYAVAIALGLVLLVPARAGVYAAASPQMRWDADSAARAAGIRGAVILVRESWGSQLLARMHALGVSRSDASLIYRRTDTCLLEEGVTALEGRNVRGEAAVAALSSMMADSARIIPSPFSPRTAERVLPGTTYGARCLTRIAEDRAGFTTFTPLALARENVYARDLHERNALLLASYPGRPVYLLKPESEEPGAPLRFLPLSRDSLVRR